MQAHHQRLHIGDRFQVIHDQQRGCLAQSLAHLRFAAFGRLAGWRQGQALRQGFQQLSELMFLPGIDVLGPLPEPIQITTVFAGGVPTASRQPQAAQALLERLAAPDLTAIKRANGMDSA